MKKGIVLYSLSALVAFQAHAIEGTTPDKMVTDEAFARKAAADNLAEIAMGRLAQKNSNSLTVKNYGAMLVEDHSRALENLKTAAKGIPLPESPLPEQQKHYNMLAELSGKEFNEMFAKHMIDDHKKAIEAFEHEVRSGQNPDIKAYAENTLGTLKEHLKKAEKLD